MISHLFSAAVPILLFSILSIITTLYLGVKLTPSEFGDFALLKTFILIGTTFSILGIDNYHIRFGNQNQLGIKYVHVCLITTIMSAVFSALIVTLYNIDRERAFLLWVILVSNSNLLYFSSIFRVKFRLFYSQLFYNSWKIFLFLFLSIIIIDNNYLTILNLYLFLALPLICTFGMGAFFLAQKSHQNIENVSFRAWFKDGWYFWVINIFTLLFAGLDILIIPLLIDKSTLGFYHAVTFIYLTGFSLLGSILAYVLYPYISQNKLVDWKFITKLLLIGISILITILLVFSQKIFSIAYAGNYVNLLNFHTVIFLLVFGVLQTFHVVFHFYIYAMANKMELTMYLMFVIGVCLFYIISFLFVSQFITYTYSIIIMHVLIIWIIKFCLMLYLMYKISPEYIRDKLDFSIIS